MGRKRKTTFVESALMNNRTYIQYYNRLTELALSMFEWTNLPKTVDARFLEMCLFSEGKAVFFEDKDLGYVGLQCAISGRLNVYRIPINRRAYASNGYNKDLTDKDSVIIYNNFMHTNSKLDVEMFSKRLYNLDRIIDVNANAQKTPVLIKCTEEERMTMLNLYKDFDGNVQEESVDKKRFDEITSQGGKVLEVQDKGLIYNVEYKDKEGNIRELKNANATQINDIISSGGIIQKQLESYYSADDVTTEARRYWTTSELKSPNGSGAKTAVEQFLFNLETEKGYTYKSYEYDENGIAIRDKDGKQKIGETGTYNSTIEDGRRVIIHEYQTDAGKQEVKYKEVGGGMLEYVIDGKVHTIDMYQLACNIKKKTDANRTVLADEKSTIEREKIKKYKDQIEAIDVVLKQRDEKQKEELLNEYEVLFKIND